MIAVPSKQEFKDLLTKPWPSSETPAKGAIHYEAVRVDRRLAFLIAGFGLLLPILLTLPDLVRPPHEFRGALSEYYYSSTRDVFVGGLCAIGLFLVAYRIFDTGAENRTSTIAGISVGLVALFPMKPPSPDATTLSLAERIVGSAAVVEWIHFSGAAVFISGLALMSYAFSLEPEAGRRATLQRFCGGTGVSWLEWKFALLVGETVSVWAFSVSWFERYFGARISRTA